MDADMTKVEITWAALLMGSFLLPAAIMCFRFNWLVGGITCVTMWIGTIGWHVNRYGFDAVGPFITSIFLFGAVAFVITVIGALFSGGAQYVSNGLPQARPRGRRYTVNGDPEWKHEVPPPASFLKKKTTFPKRKSKPS